ncbi:hypothetical protein [Roseivivax jejudonensis]|uniref:hypothetical protein n=1 Tax=Roseivivax jejudonensis TaxID=1529041 RepID=UPI001F405DD5|nr:hypothetical protein [Roseivivax jejudonensis]
MTDAAAGAWPRERGAWFASATVNLTWPQDLGDVDRAAPDGRYDALYLEYGLTDRITLGLDVGRSVSGEAKLVAFAQHPVLPADAPLRAAAQLGIGKIDDRDVLRPGLSVGRGWEGGWLSTDALLEQPFDGTGADVKLDATWGLRLRADRRLILQLQTGKQTGDPAFARLAPSLVMPLRGPLSAEVGGTYGVTGDDSVGLKLGLWAEF